MKVGLGKSLVFTDTRHRVLEGVPLNHLIRAEGTCSGVDVLLKNADGKSTIIRTVIPKANTNQFEIAAGKLNDMLGEFLLESKSRTLDLNKAVCEILGKPIRHLHKLFL